MGGERASKTRQREAGRICWSCSTPLPPDPAHVSGERQCSRCSGRPPRPHEVIMNFQTDTARAGGWAVTFLLPDARTSVGRRYRPRSVESLQAMVMRTRPHKGTLEKLNRDIARWSRGSVHLYLTEQEFLALAAGKSKIASAHP